MSADGFDVETDFLRFPCMSRFFADLSSGH
jgi:hypothetical protein